MKVEYSKSAYGQSCKFYKLLNNVSHLRRNFMFVLILMIYIKIVKTII